MKIDLTKQQKRSIVYYINKLCNERGYEISNRFNYLTPNNDYDLASVTFQYQNKSEIKAWREYRKLKKYGFGKIKGLYVYPEFSTWSGLSGTIYIELDFLEYLRIVERKEKIMKINNESQNEDIKLESLPLIDKFDEIHKLLN